MREEKRKGGEEEGGRREERRKGKGGEEGRKTNCIFETNTSISRSSPDRNIQTIQFSGVEFYVHTNVNSDPPSHPALF